ncbi:MAG: hypothetical protein H0V53_06675 [Rubrobacter sp.]|nr:hypothetical protein [Rubrobacter sp.]
MRAATSPGRIRSLSAVGGVGAAVYAAAALSLVAALAHLWAAPEHFAEWWGYGSFFLAAALAQGIYGVLALRWPRQPLFLLGIGGNLAIVLLYVVTRTAGIPFLGPHAGEVEAAGMLDMAATVAEVALIFLLVTLLEGRYRERVVTALLLLGAAVWASRLLGLLS